MGRVKEQGPKNLAKVIDQAARFQKVFVTRGSSRLPYQFSVERYDELVNRFERRGWTVEKAGE